MALALAIGLAGCSGKGGDTGETGGTAGGEVTAIRPAARWRT